MAANDEPKMAELKRLLRRLDGLDGGRRDPGPGGDADAEQRDYVGSLRGAADQEEGQPAGQVAAPVTVTARSAALLAGAVAAAFSTAVVYVFMSAEPRSTLPRETKPIGAGHILPGDRPNDPPATGDPNEVSRELVRSATLLLEKGNVDGARELLRRAAELGSGPAALELARSYDPERSAAEATPDARTTNQALARAWYERARDLGIETPPP